MHCQPLLVPKPPAGLGCLHEVKHDGYRIIARKDGSRVTLWSRYGTNFADRLPKIAEAVCSLAAESAPIDGEAVAVRQTGIRILLPYAQRWARHGPASSRSIF
jgi:bifunctional non-homologous end joining protein LigD